MVILRLSLFFAFIKWLKMEFVHQLQIATSIIALGSRVWQLDLFEVIKLLPFLILQYTMVEDSLARTKGAHNLLCEGW